MIVTAVSMHLWDERDLLPPFRQDSRRGFARVHPVATTIGVPAWTRQQVQEDQGLLDMFSPRRTASPLPNTPGSAPASPQDVDLTGASSVTAGQSVASASASAHNVNMETRAQEARSLLTQLRSLKARC